MFYFMFLFNYWRSDWFCIKRELTVMHCEQFNKTTCTRQTQQAYSADLSLSKHGWLIEFMPWNLPCFNRNYKIAVRLVRCAIAEQWIYFWNSAPALSICTPVTRVSMHRATWIPQSIHDDSSVWADHFYWTLVIFLAYHSMINICRHWHKAPGNDNTFI